MDEHEQGKLEGLLRHALKNDSTLEECPGSDFLAAYFERSLEAGEALRLEAHLSVCARCREELAVLARTEESVEETAETLTAADQQPELVEAPSRPLKRLWFWGVWAPAGATAVAVLIFWVVVKHRRPEFARERVEKPAQVASYQAPSPAPSASPETKTEAHTSALGAPEKTPVDKALLEKKESEMASVHKGVPASSAKSVTKPATRALLGKLPPPPPVAKKKEGNVTEVEESAAQEAPSVTAGQSPPGANADALVMSRERPVAPDAGRVERALTPPPNAGPAVNGRMATAPRYPVKSQIFAETVAIAPLGTTRIPTPEASSLWRIKSGRFVEFSGDSGRSWAATLTSVIQLLAGSAPSEQVCWIAGKQGMILRTKDHEHFQRIHPPVVADFTAVAAQDAEIATVTASDGRKFSTQDGGRTWQPQP